MEVNTGEQNINWDFNAPTFVDFQNDEHEKSIEVDDYFNHDHESLNSAGLIQDGFANELNIEMMDEENNNQQTNIKEKESTEDANIEPVANHTEESSSNLTDEVKTAQDLGSSNSCENEPARIKENISINNDNVLINEHSSFEQNYKEQDITTESGSEVQPAKPSITSEIDTDSLEEEENGKDECGDAENKDEITNNVDSTECDEIMESNAPEEENKNASEEPKEMDTSPATRRTPPTPNEEKRNAEVLANLITPSRLASWERSRRTRRSVATTSTSTNDHRSKRLEKLKVIRKSGRSLTPANPADPPPTKKVKKNPPRVKLTESITPTVLRHSRNASVPKVKSTEEMELEEIEELKYQAKQMAKEASKSFKRALKNPSAHTPSGTPSAKLTKVKEFKFQTDNRIKSNHSMDTRSRKLSSEIDFTKGLRQHPPSPTKLKKTVVKPFNLSSNRKRKAVEPATSLKGYDFTPMAKAVMNFNKGTRVNTAKAEIRKGPMKAKLGLTVAKTPKLESRSRTRTVTVVGQKEMEDQEVKEMKNYQFKAKPVNRDILDHPGALPEVKKCPPTKPIGFNLEIDKRVEGRPVHDKVESPTKEFKARPLPTKILEGPQEVPKPEPIKPTVPQSPAFKLKNRMHIAQIRKENKENFEKEQAKAKALAEKGKNETAFKKPVVTAKKSIEKKCEVKPFSFDSRDKERFAKKEEKIKQILESEKAIASSFRATPICQPIDPVKALPAKNIKPSTEPKPFHMYSDERGALRAEKWKQEVEEEVKALREKTEFKANTNYSKVIHGKAFKPAINKKYTETFQEFALHTDRRALQREEFDEFLKHKEAESQARNEMLKMENERIEQERYERERKEAEHRANPVRKYKPVLMRQSEKELTQPQSPQFSDRFYKKC